MNYILRISHIAKYKFPEAVTIQDSWVTVISLCLVSRVNSVQYIGNEMPINYDHIGHWSNRRTFNYIMGNVYENLRQHRVSLCEYEKVWYDIQPFFGGWRIDFDLVIGVHLTLHWLKLPDATWNLDFGNNFSPTALLWRGVRIPSRAFSQHSTLGFWTTETNWQNA